MLKRGDLNLVSQIVLDRVGQYEVTVSETLHQSRSTEAVSTVVGEVSFTDSEEARDRGHKLVVHPDTTHRVVDSGIDHHRRLVGIVVGDLFVHLEEVTIASFYDILTQTLDSAGEVEEDSQTRVVDTVASVAAFLSSTAGDVTRHEVTEAG